MFTVLDFDKAFRKAEAADDFKRCANIEAEAEEVLSEEDFQAFIELGNPVAIDPEEDLTEGE